MKILTALQPFASLIAFPDSDPLAKRIENRFAETPYRGPVLIHAGKSRERLRPDKTGEYDAVWGLPIAPMAFGAVVAVVNLMDCFRVTATSEGIQWMPREAARRWPWVEKDRHAQGPVCWILGNVRTLAEPIPWLGKQGLREADVELVALADRQLKGLEVGA
ncbi:MAG: hypothetical protein ABI353_11620 [Isosphaeraceae bacterium]